MHAIGRHWTYELFYLFFLLAYFKPTAIHFFLEGVLDDRSCRSSHRSPRENEAIIVDVAIARALFTPQHPHRYLIYIYYIYYISQRVRDLRIRAFFPRPFSFALEHGSSGSRGSFNSDQVARDAFFLYSCS